jgi:hypothetical protein
VFKIADLVEIAGKKGVSGGRNATRDSLVSALVKAGVSEADLTKGQRAELGAGAGAGGSSRWVRERWCAGKGGGGGPVLGAQQTARSQ